MDKIMIQENQKKKGGLYRFEEGRFSTKQRLADLFLLRYCFVDIEYQFSINPELTPAGDTPEAGSEGSSGEVSDTGDSDVEGTSGRRSRNRRSPSPSSAAFSRGKSTRGSGVGMVSSGSSANFLQNDSPSRKDKSGSLSSTSVGSSAAGGPYARRAAGVDLNDAASYHSLEHFLALTNKADLTMKVWRDRDGIQGFKWLHDYVFKPVDATADTNFISEEDGGAP